MVRMPVVHHGLVVVEGLRTGVESGVNSLAAGRMLAVDGNRKPAAADHSMYRLHHGWSHGLRSSVLAWFDSMVYIRLVSCLGSSFFLSLSSSPINPLKSSASPFSFFMNDMFVMDCPRDHESG